MGWKYRLFQLNCPSLFFTHCPANYHELPQPMCSLMAGLYDISQNKLLISVLKQQGSRAALFVFCTHLYQLETLIRLMWGCQLWRGAKPSILLKERKPSSKCPPLVVALPPSFPLTWPVCVCVCALVRALVYACVSCVCASELNKKHFKRLAANVMTLSEHWAEQLTLIIIQQSTAVSLCSIRKYLML